MRLLGEYLSRRMDKMEARLGCISESGLATPEPEEMNKLDLSKKVNKLKTPEDFTQFEEAVDHNQRLMEMIVSVFRHIR